jgi:YidC/Oxa1 family membrane protein insertase
MDLVYNFINRPAFINTTTLGILDLSEKSVILAILAGAAQFWQTKMLSSKQAPIKNSGAKDENMAAMMNKQMTYMMPVLTVFFGISLPGGLTFYWLITTLLTVAQQYLLFKKQEQPK